MKKQGWWVLSAIAVGAFCGGIGFGALSRQFSRSAQADFGARSAGETKPAVTSQADSPADAAALRGFFSEAEQAASSGDWEKAKQLYQQVLQMGAAGEAAATAQERLWQINLKLILTPMENPNAAAYFVLPGDSLIKIARGSHTTVDLLKQANGLTGDRIRPGQRLKIPKTDFSVVIDKSQNTLTLKSGEEVVKVYRCSTGKGGITPVGKFKIVNRIVDPPWYSSQGVIPPGDPRNLLGSRWMGFDLAGYGIHGTTDSGSIGRAVTEGCVRLANREVEELFALLPEETKVSIVE